MFRSYLAQRTSPHRSSPGVRLEENGCRDLFGCVVACARCLSKDINPVNTFEAVRALVQIIDFIDSDEVDAALSRIDARDHFRVMEFRYPEAPR